MAAGSSSASARLASAGTIGLSDEHAELHAAARRWVGAHVDPGATRKALDAAEETTPPFWDELRATGWLGLHLPEALGGEGYGLLELACVLEELGRAATPGPFLPTVLASTVLATLGSRALVDEVVPDLATGARTGALGIGADPLEADSVRGGLRLSGATRPVLGAGLADVLVLPARRLLSGGRRSAELWCVVHRDEVEVVPLPSVDATRRVAEVRVPDLVLEPHRVLRSALTPTVVRDVAASLTAAESVGAMGWCVETAAAYAVDRIQFGRPIGQFQAVKHRVADMLLRLEVARAAAWDVARGGGEADERELSAAVAGALVADAAFTVAKDLVQVLGGVGYTWEHDAHLYLKRATANRQLLGGGAAWRSKVARLALRGDRRTLSVDLPPEADPVRDEVRAFLDDLTARPSAEWTRAMAESGYLVPAWPTPWGRDASAIEQLVIDQEFGAAGVRRPHLQVAAWVLPTIIGHGTAEQQERWVRPTLRGEVLWCQLFSEPGAGSDLASLSTRAERVDGGWSITGQKVWTTLAHVATWGLLLARTDPEAPKHEGITAFCVDMRSAGIETRPLRELTGAELFNEVFFDDVFVPDDCVVGPVHGGWEAARTTLANERVSMGSGSSFGPGVEAVLRLVSTSGAGDDPLVLDEVGGLVAMGQAIAVLGLRTTLRALGGAQPGPEASVRKLLGVEHDQHIQEVGLALVGGQGAATDGDAAPWIAGFLGNRALSIAGGTSDIQRNIIAERLLGLPKDPEPGA